MSEGVERTSRGEIGTYLTLKGTINGMRGSNLLTAKDVKETFNHAGGGQGRRRVVHRTALRTEADSPMLQDQRPLYNMQSGTPHNDR